MSPADVAHLSAADVVRLDLLDLLEAIHPVLNGVAEPADWAVAEITARTIRRRYWPSSSRPQHPQPERKPAMPDTDELDLPTLDSHPDDPWEAQLDNETLDLPASQWDTPDLVARIDRMMAVLAAKEARAAAIQNRAKALRDCALRWAIERHKAETCDPVSIDRIEQAIVEAAIELRKRDPKTKSVSTAFGTVSTRKADVWQWRNDEQLLAWLKAQGLAELVDTKTTESVARSAIKRAAQVKDGQVVIEGQAVPGDLVGVTEGAISVSITSADQP
jgi:phage host-nuclease inhibitor protein Gam